MNYIWEVVLKAQEQGKTPADLTFRPARPANPYMETAFSDINQSTPTEPVVEINAMYRFGFIFQTLLDIEYKDDTEIKEFLFDILMHYLAQIDTRQGLCRWEYYQQFLKQDFAGGKFGTPYKEIFASYNKQQERQLLAHLLGQYKTGASLFFLRTIIKTMYPRSITYLQTETKEILIYIGKKETPELRRQVEYLIDAFMPFDYTAQLFWDKHFGIIGIDETMITDEIILF